VGLERGPLSLVSTIELLGRKSSGSGLESREYGRTGYVALTTRHRLSAKLALTSPRSGGGSVGIVGSLTEAMEFSLVYKLVRVPVWSRMFISPCPERLWGLPSLLSNMHQGLSSRKHSVQGVSLTTHLQPVPRSRKRGSIHPLPHTSLRRDGIVILNTIISSANSYKVIQSSFRSSAS
jgi:hypothetical protein